VPQLAAVPTSDLADGQPATPPPPTEPDAATPRSPAPPPAPGTPSHIPPAPPASADQPDDQPVDPPSVAAEEASDPTPNTVAADPFAEFAVYDDDIEWEYDAPEEDANDSPRRTVNKVAVPRSMLYAQGILIGVVALGAFALGLLVGSRGPEPDPSLDAIAICTVSGQVQIETEGLGVLPDEDAVVIAVPRDQRPAAAGRADIAGLRPSDPRPASTNQGLTVLREMGGAYARADAEGRYSLRVAAGEYFLLVLSHGKYRDAADDPPRDDLAQLGRYFLPATELLGDSRYRWTSVTIRRDEAMDWVF